MEPTIWTFKPPTDNEVWAFHGCDPLTKKAIWSKPEGALIKVLVIVYRDDESGYDGKWFKLTPAEVQAVMPGPIVSVDAIQERLLALFQVGAPLC